MISLVAACAGGAASSARPTNDAAMWPIFGRLACVRTGSPLCVAPRAPCAAGLVREANPACPTTMRQRTDDWLRDERPASRCIHPLSDRPIPRPNPRGGAESRPRNAKGQGACAPWALAFELPRIYVPQRIDTAAARASCGPDPQIRPALPEAAAGPGAPTPARGSPNRWAWLPSREPRPSTPSRPVLWVIAAIAARELPHPCRHLRQRRRAPPAAPRWSASPRSTLPRKPASPAPAPGSRPPRAPPAPGRGRSSRASTGATCTAPEPDEISIEADISDSAPREVPRPYCEKSKSSVIPGG